MAVVSLTDTRLARLPFPLQSGLAFEGNSTARSAWELHRYCCRLCSFLLSMGVSPNKDAGLDAGLELGWLRGVCGCGRGEPEWPRGGLS